MATDFHVNRLDILNQAEKARQKALSHSPIDLQNVHLSTYDNIDDVAQNLKFKNNSYKSIQNKNGFLWAFGRNKDGELGIGSTNDLKTP